MKRVIILGSTGSIGKNTLEIIRRDRKNFKVVGLSAFSNIAVLRKQVKEFKPGYVAIQDVKKARQFRKHVCGCFVLEGEAGLLELAGKKSDILVLGISGLAALKPLCAALDRAKRILLANKEAVISGGALLSRAFKNSKTEIFPVDSEAWAVFRLLQNLKRSLVKSVYITASGGPFLFKDTRFMRKVKPKAVLNHPVWKMGRRITVDSANLMNKGFEVLELNTLFGISLNQIKVLVHPQSAMHALVQMEDSTLFAAMFSADMKIPIAYSAYYPDKPCFSRDLNLGKLARLDFFTPDLSKFPALNLAYRVGFKSGNCPAVFVAADAEAVAHFLNGKIGFLDIYDKVEKVVRILKVCPLVSLEDVFFWAAWARRKLREEIR